MSSRRQGLALGIQKSGIPTASLLGGLAVPAVGLTIGWSWAFVLGGLLAFAVSLGVPAIAAAPSAEGGPGRGIRSRVSSEAVWMIRSTRWDSMVRSRSLMSPMSPLTKSTEPLSSRSARLRSLKAMS